MITVTTDPLVREMFVIGLALGVGIGFWAGGHAWWLIMRPKRTPRRRSWRGVWR